MIFFRLQSVVYEVGISISENWLTPIDYGLICQMGWFVNVLSVLSYWSFMLIKNVVKSRYTIQIGLSSSPVIQYTVTKVYNLQISLMCLHKVWLAYANMKTLTMTMMTKNQNIHLNVRSCRFHILSYVGVHKWNNVHADVPIISKALDIVLCTRVWRLKRKGRLLQCRGAENYLCHHQQPWLQRISI